MVFCTFIRVKKIGIHKMLEAKLVTSNVCDTSARPTGPRALEIRMTVRVDKNMVGDCISNRKISEGC